jgi:hypothetical protein
MWAECHTKELSRKFGNIPNGKRSVGKPRKRWLNDAENYLKKMGQAGEK